MSEGLYGSYKPKASSSSPTSCVRLFQRKFAVDLGGARGERIVHPPDARVLYIFAFFGLTLILQ